ncbi:MAG TPA: hypothetical protein VFK09_11530 [Gemmatimonadales bacterium]|jgi:hypothetical protein|nr:hypothetical protein [Gemmatimonadales bacterium]
MRTQSGKLYRLKLSPRQIEEIKELTNREAEALVFTVEEIEQRITPVLAAH